MKTSEIAAWCLAVFLCLCVLGAGAGLLYAGDGATTIASQGPAGGVDERGKVRNVVGIVVQVIFFLLFLGLIYYVFVYPEEGDEGKKKDGGEGGTGDGAEGSSPAPGEEEEEEKEDAAGEESGDADA